VTAIKSISTVIAASMSEKRPSKMMATESARMPRTMPTTAIASVARIDARNSRTSNAPRS